jgi:antitoxin component YwqK of YwqJK toxin-antitoxin module
VTPQPLEVITGSFLVRYGITYDQNTNEPVTGIVEEFYDDGQLKSRGTYIDGRKDGLWEWFYENGQLEHRTTFRDAESD